VTARTVRAAVGCLLLVALAGCGGKPAPKAGSTRPDEVTLTPAADGSQQVQIDADDSYRFHPSLVRAAPGPVEVTLHNVGEGTPHNWTAGTLPGAAVPLIRGGESRSVRFTVSRAGDYRFVCTIHERQGQVGRLVVSAP
jgi:plastocyanin